MSRLSGIIPRAIVVEQAVILILKRKKFTATHFSDDILLSKPKKGQL